MKKTLTLLLSFSALLFSKDLAAQCPDVNAAFTTSQLNICGAGPQVITFNNTSTGANNGTATYEWFLNGVSFDNTAGLAAPINSNISAVGVYNYMLVATDASVPCTDTAFVTVNIYPQPNANFIFNPDNVCAGTLINFTNTSSGTQGTSVYAWNFGDGNTANTQHATHTYGAGGTFNATLTVTNGPGCNSAVNQTVTMMDIPNVNIAGDDGDGDLINCLLPADPSTSETVTFFNTTTGGVSYTWDFGDGSPLFTTGSTAPFTHDYTSYGTYTVTMTATHANGCTATETLTVVFEKYVSAAMTLDITEYSGCTPHDLSTLTNLSVNANSYIWDFGDGTIINTTSPVPPAHNYLVDGTYTISLTAINSCNMANATISPIIIIGGPTANFNTTLPFGGGTIGCAPQNMDVNNLSVDAQPANNYFWDMGNGNTYTNVVVPPTQTYDTTGVYTVMLVATNACGPDTVLLDITIDTVPVIDITSIPLDGCSPLTVNTTNNSYTNPINYQWFVDGLFTTAAQNLPNQTFVNSGTNAPVNHTIQLNGNNICGNGTDTETIVVHPETIANFTLTTDTICVGDAITFTDLSTGEALTYDWDFGVQTETTPGPHTVTYNVDGNYTVELIVDGFCGPDTATIDVVVLPYPIADFTVDVATGCVDFDVALTNNSTLGGTYNWIFNGGAPGTSTLYSPAPVNYSASGTFNITLDVNVLGCVSSDTVVIQANPLPLPSFTILPNDGCTPLDVAFTNTSPNNPGDVFDWDFGNGNTFTGQNPNNETYIALANDSIYNVQLIITTADGCVDSAQGIVTVHPLPIADYTALPDTACAGDPIAFLNNSIGASSYEWDFGDGNTSTQTSPSNTYALTGDIMTQLVATTVFGCTDTLQVPIYVDSIPTADFNFNIVCDIDSTDFTDLSIGAPTNWSWDFGDGNTSTDQNPTHFYGAAGTYNVILTVTNPAACTHSINQLVDVSLVPVADFTTNSTCFGSPSQFTDLTTGIPTTWQWDFGDVSPIDNSQNPTHVYGAIGVFNVTLIAEAGNGCSDTITMPITVTPIPTADFNFAAVCTGDTTFFTDASLGAPDTYFWDFGDGTTDNTNNPNPEHVYTTAGSYNVMLVAGYSASGCTDTLIQIVDAHPLTTPNFTTNTPCLGGATVFTDLSGGVPTQWEWDFGDLSPLDFSQNPTHVYAADGNYTVQLVTENVFGCSDTFQTIVTVFPLPTADFTFTTVCLNATTAFTDISLGAVAWEWDFGDASPLDNNQHPTHVYAAAGSFNVQLIVTNSDGCTDTMVQAITVNPNPTADYTASVACHTYPTFFTDLSAGALNYYWDFGDGSPTDNNASPAYTYADAGTYNVQMVVENVFGCTDTATQVVDVLIQPQAGFTTTNVCAGETTVFTDTSTLGPTSWEWDFGDGSPVDNNQHPLHLFNPGGVYNVSLVVGNIAGCTATAVIPVNVYTVPVPDFLADTVCLFSITTFTDLSTDAVPIVQWDWDFDDGNTSFTQNPTYIFQAAGQYDVELIVTNGDGCDSSIIIPVFVSDIPVADFTADTVCIGNPTSFVDISTGFPNAWTWSFGDGNVSNVGPNVQHTYSAAGSYIASLLVTAGGACTDQVFQVIEVIDNVSAGITLTNDSLCDGNAFNFADNSTITIGNIVSYFWDFGDGNSANTPNASHTYAGPGTYTVTYTVTTDGGCSNTITQDVTVMDLPIALFQDLTACQNNVTSFSDLSVIGGGSIATWTWDFGDGSPIVTSQNPSHVFASDGLYDVSLTVTSALGCAATVVIPTVVYPSPVADFSSPLSCPDDTVQYTDLSTISSGTIVGWAWDFGDGSSDVAQHPLHAFQVPGDNFDVTLIVTSNFGCTDTAVINTLTHPYPTFQYGPEWASGCQPLSVQFNDSSIVAGGIITNWEWDFDDGSMSFAQNPIHIFTDPGSYYVGLNLTTSQGCTFADTLLYPVIVYPKPEAAFVPLHTELSILEPEIQFTDLSTGAIDYEWYFGDGNYSNVQSPLHEYTDTGYYQVMEIVYSDFGCSDTAINTVHVYGVYAIYVPNTFTPNGDSKNQYFRAYGMAIEKFDMWIFNRWGEEIWHANDMDQSWDGQYNGHVVQDDVYVWKIICFDTNGDEHELYGHVTVLK